MSEIIRVAVPVQSGEGLGAEFSAHFGHAPGFALIDVADGTPQTVRMLENPPHSHGGCGLIVNTLAANGVNAVVAGGMGRGPLVGLLNAGIAVHHDGSAATVADAVASYLEGRAPHFSEDHSCQGGHH